MVDGAVEAVVDVCVEQALDVGQAEEADGRVVARPGPAGPLGGPEGPDQERVALLAPTQVPVNAAEDRAVLREVRVPRDVVLLAVGGVALQCHLYRVRLYVYLRRHLLVRNLLQENGNLRDFE